MGDCSGDKLRAGLLERLGDAEGEVPVDTGICKFKIFLCNSGFRMDSDTN